MLSTGKIIFAAGIAVIILSLAALSICTRMLKKSEKRIEESIWREYR